MGEYIDILKNKKNATEACSAFFCYAVAIRAKYLQLVLLYYRSISSDLHIAIHTIQNYPSATTVTKKEFSRRFMGSTMMSGGWQRSNYAYSPIYVLFNQTLGIQ